MSAAALQALESRPCLGSTVSRLPASVCQLGSVSCPQLPAFERRRYRRRHTTRRPTPACHNPQLQRRSRRSERAATARDAAGAGRGRAGAGRRRTAETRRRAGRRRAFSARSTAGWCGGRGLWAAAWWREPSRGSGGESGPGREQTWRRGGPGPAPLRAAWAPSSRAGPERGRRRRRQLRPRPPPSQAPRPAPGPPAMVTHAAAARRRQDHG